VLSPALGFGLVFLLGLQGLTARVLVAESAFPIAVMATVLATEFRARPEDVAASTLISFLASAATVTVVLRFSALLP